MQDYIFKLKKPLGADYQLRDSLGNVLVSSKHYEVIDRKRNEAVQNGVPVEELTTYLVGRYENELGEIITEEMTITDIVTYAKRKDIDM